MVAWDELYAAANASLGEVSIIKSTADSLKVQPAVVFGAAALFVLSFTLYGFCGQLICNLVGTAYPAFESFKALESGQHQLVRFWLTYWVVFSVIQLVETLWYYLLIWFPMYYFLKLVLLFWLYLPSTHGAEKFYKWFIGPVLTRNRDHIDEAIQKSTKEMKRSLSGIPQVMSTSAVTVGIGALSAGASGVNRLRKSLSKGFDDKNDQSSKECELKGAVCTEQPIGPPPRISESAAEGDVQDTAPGENLHTD